MKAQNILIILLALLILSSSCKTHESTIAFYNVENLFDTLDDQQIRDEEYLPSAEKQWNSSKYQNKLDSLSKVISMLGKDGGPQVLGLCEVENKAVIQDLILNSKLKKSKYQIVHKDSEDGRGIDVALIYTKPFSLESYNLIPVRLEDDADWRTRDILHAELKLNKESIHFFVNHWPSRWGGKEESEYKRMAASNALKSYISELRKKEQDPKIIIMGDFNDETMDNSLLNLDKIQLANLMKTFDVEEKGSYRYRGNWNMLDQILVSENLLEAEGIKYKANSSFIFEKEWLKQKGYENPFAGYPLRTWGGKTYLGGFSDHFAVGMLLVH